MQDYILPIFPLPALVGASWEGPLDTEQAANRYAAALESLIPDLLQKVQATCGAGPWIVRSAGDEDLADNVNAGGYDSLICSDPNALLNCVAAVALSGAKQQAQQQLALSGHHGGGRAIASFVQPLLDVEVSKGVSLDHSPYVPPETLEELETICSDLMQIFGFTAIDCEWGLETTLGFVSVTTVMPEDTNRMNTAHTMGFGFGSAQNCGARATSLMLRPAGSSLRLWRARHLRSLRVRKIHLLQVRPAQLQDAFRDLHVLTQDCRHALRERYLAVPGGLLNLGHEPSGRALVAADLMSAWRQYLSLDTSTQASIRVVLVEEGSAEEHAGIMFRQQKLTCVKIKAGALSSTADSAIYDRGTCFLGDRSMLRNIQTEHQRVQVIPDECALVFEASESAEVCAERLDQLQRLGVSQEVKSALAESSELPTPTRWLQDVHGAVESPSRLALAWRTDCSEIDSDLPSFARRYALAVKQTKGNEHEDLSDLCKISSATASLLASKDLRIVMALFDCQYARSWVSEEALRSLLESASKRLANAEYDYAVLILNSIDLVRVECSRLPVHTPQEALFYVESFTLAFGMDLGLSDVLTIRSLGLSIGSEVLLLIQAAAKPSVLEAVIGFRASLAGFRTGVSATDTTSLPAEPLKAAYLCLRATLAEAGLETIAEHIRGTLIETFDASLKTLLGRVVDERSTQSYHCYLFVMQHWVDFLSMSSLRGDEISALEQFRVWLG